MIRLWVPLLSILLGGGLVFGGIVVVGVQPETENERPDLDPSVIRLPNRGEPTVLTSGAGNVWVASGNAVYRVDPRGPMAAIYPAGPRGAITVTGIVATPKKTWISYTDHRCHADFPTTPGCGFVATVASGETVARNPAVIGGPVRAMLRLRDGLLVATARSMLMLSDDGTRKEFPRRGVADILGLVTAMARVQALVRVDDAAKTTAVIQIETYRGRSESRFDVPDASSLHRGAGSMWLTTRGHRGHELVQVIGSNVIVRRLPLDFADGAPVYPAFSGAELVVAGTTAKGTGEVQTFDLRDGTLTARVSTLAPVVGAIAAYNELWLLHRNPARLSRMGLPDPRATHPPAPSDRSYDGLVTERPGLLGPEVSGVERVDVGKDGRTLTVHFLGGFYPCSVLDHIEVIETARTVDTIVVTGLDVAGESLPEYVCADIGIQRHAIVTLKAPLGDRSLNTYSAYS